MAKKPEDRLDLQVTVRLDAGLVKRTAALIAKLGGVTTRVKILREAMRLGLDVLEERYRHMPDPIAPPRSAKKR